MKVGDKVRIVRGKDLTTIRLDGKEGIIVKGEMVSLNGISMFDVKIGGNTYRCFSSELEYAEDE